MIILLPFFYLFIGLLLGKTSWDIRSSASWFLTKIIIPVVITFNISTQFSNMGSIIFITAIVMLSMLMLGKYIINDPVMLLCFTYLNIGWLGLPVASSLFGNDAALIVIAAYVGSSVVGNSFGAGILASNKINLIKLLQTPPVLALFTGIFLIPFRQQVTHWFYDVYEVAKFLMSFLGMGVLGLWLSKTNFNFRDLRPEIIFFIKRAVVIFFIITLLLYIARLFNQTLITNNPETLYLFCFLPPAANIIVLETHYMGTGRSARTISCGTCLSIIAITIYSVVIFGLRNIYL
ncbi:permease [Salmonella enterica]|nr:permease [Salmonella enterica]